MPIISLSKSSRVTIICDRELLCDISWDRVRSNVHEPHKKAWVDMGSNRHFSMRSGSRTGEPPNYIIILGTCHRRSWILQGRR